MYISLDNAVKSLSEYVSQEFAKIEPDIVPAAASIYIQYKLQTQGRKLMSALDNGDGKISIDILSDLVNKHTANMPDKTFRTPFGELKITGDTPAKLMEHMKRYGEN